MGFQQIKEKCFDELEELSLIMKDSKKDSNLVEKEEVKKLLNKYLDICFNFGRVQIIKDYKRKDE